MRSDFSLNTDTTHKQTCWGGGLSARLRVDHEHQGSKRSEDLLRIALVALSHELFCKGRQRNTRAFYEKYNSFTHVFNDFKGFFG